MTIIHHQLIHQWPTLRTSRRFLDIAIELFRKTSAKNIRRSNRLVLRIPSTTSSSTNLFEFGFDIPLGLTSTPPAVALASGTHHSHPRQLHQGKLLSLLPLQHLRQQQQEHQQPQLHHARPPLPLQHPGKGAPPIAWSGNQPVL